MEFAAEMYLDREAARRVRALWHALEAVGAGTCLERAGTEPHVRLAAFDELDSTRALSAASRFVESCEPVSIVFRTVGAFTTSERVLFLAPASNEELMAIHAEFHAFLRGMAVVCSPSYRPGRWVPHCTLARHVPKDAFAGALETARGAFAKFDARLVALGIVEYAPTARPLWRRPLQA